MFNSEIMNKLGSAQHEIWSNWMKFLFTQGYNLEDGTFKIKRDKVERWKRQMKTPFDELSKEEQETDVQVVKDHLNEVMVLFVEEAVRASLDNLEKDFVLIEKETWEELQGEIEKIEKGIEEL